MWLINTETLELEEFLNETRPRYAILSHTWGAKETTFSKFIESEKVARNDTKIFNTCRIARNYGLEYAWIDTCCIDKRSSAELSEAINSMYQWYRDAAVCFVYLDDVSQSISIIDGVRDCRWRTRGWTLQELIAPKVVHFFDGGWQLRGDKTELLEPLCKHTGIPGELLDGTKSVECYEAASKMAWASERRTSRTEDLAYCLMGIFNVNMPLLYGEGSKAFQRLQEEILRRRPDLSLLLWHGLKNIIIDGLKPASELWLSGPKHHFVPFSSGESLTEKKSGFLPILAKSPKDFAFADNDVVVTVDEAIEVSMNQISLVLCSDGAHIRVWEFGRPAVSFPMQYWIDVRAMMSCENLKGWLPLRKIAPGTFVIERRKEFLITEETIVSSTVMCKLSLVLRPSTHTVARAIEARKGAILVPPILLPGFHISAVRPQSHWDATDHMLFQETFGHGTQAVFAIELQALDDFDEQKFMILFEPNWHRSACCKIVRVSNSTDVASTYECSPSINQAVFGPFHDRGISWDFLVTRWPEVLEWRNTSFVQLNNPTGKYHQISVGLSRAQTLCFDSTINIFELDLKLDHNPKMTRN